MFLTVIISITFVFLFIKMFVFVAQTFELKKLDYK